METQREIQKNTTVYTFDTTDVDGKPEVLLKYLKRLVGERGFEPPTPWSRTRFRRLLNSIEFCSSQVIDIKGVADVAFRLLIPVEIRCFDRYKNVYIENRRPLDFVPPSHAFRDDLVVFSLVRKTRSRSE